nr:hypothetical protein [Tanacetum cinerariifolium]
MERGFLSQKENENGRRVKEKNNDVAAKDDVSPSVTGEIVVKKKQSSLVDTTIPTTKMDKLSSLDDTTVLGSFPSLSTPVTTTAGNAPGKSLYAYVTGKPSGKKLNIHTLFTPGGNGIDVVVPVDSIRATNAMLENGPWFIRNNPVILKKWHPNENLLKKDVSIIPVWVKLYGVPVTAFSDDGRSSYAKVMIELRADVELKDNIVLVMPRIKGEGYYTCNIRNLKKTSQTPKGISVGQNMRFKPKQVFQLVSKMSTANTSGKKMNNSESTKEVSKSNPFEVLTSFDNDMDLGKLRFMDNDGNLLVSTGIVESDSEVEVVFDETVKLKSSTSGKDRSDKGYDTNSLLEQ